jgi:hypothetical protein
MSDDNQSGRSELIVWQQRARSDNLRVVDKAEQRLVSGISKLSGTKATHEARP